MFEMESLLEAGSSFERLTTYLNDEKHEAAIKKLPWFGVDVGSAVFCPMGWIPVIVGLSSVEDEESDACAYSLNFLLHAPNGLDKGIIAEVKAEATKSVARSSKFLDPLKSSINLWTEQFPSQTG